jgi:hypothetical protein
MPGDVYAIRMGFDGTAIEGGEDRYGKEIKGAYDSPRRTPQHWNYTKNVF